MRELKTTLTVCDSGGPDPVLLDQTEPGSSCISTFCSQWDSMLNELLPRCNLLHGLPGDACSSSVSSTSRFSWFDFSHFSKYKLPEMWSCFCDTSFKTRFIWFLRIKWKTPETNPDVDLIPLSDWDKNKLLNVLNFLFIVSSVAGEQMKPAVLTKQTTFMIGTIKLYSKYKMCWSDAVEQTEEKKNMFSEIQSCCRDVLVGRGQFWICTGSVPVCLAANSWSFWTWTLCCCSLLCFERFQQQRTELWWLKTRNKQTVELFFLIFWLLLLLVFSTVRCKRTKYGVLLCVVLLTVQAQQSAVVKIFHETFELVTKRTPRLQQTQTPELTTFVSH